MKTTPQGTPETNQICEMMDVSDKTERYYTLKHERENQLIDFLKEIFPMTLQRSHDHYSRHEPEGVAYTPTNTTKGHAIRSPEDKEMGELNEEFKVKGWNQR